MRGGDDINKQKEPRWKQSDRYNKRMYLQVKVSLPKELVKRFREKCNEDNISQASVIRESIEKYLGK